MRVLPSLRIGFGSAFEHGGGGGDVCLYVAAQLRLCVGRRAFGREPAHGALAIVARRFLERITFFHVSSADGDQSDGAVSHGLLRLHPAVAEMGALTAGKARRRAVHDDGDLAAHVGVGVVVVMQMRSADAVTDENRRSFYANVSRSLVAAQQDVFIDFQRRGFAVALHDHRTLLGNHGDAAKRDLLPVSVDAGGLQAEQLELSLHVAGGDLVAARAGAAAFE